MKKQAVRIKFESDKTPSGIVKHGRPRTMARGSRLTCYCCGHAVSGVDTIRQVLTTSVF